VVEQSLDTAESDHGVWVQALVATGYEVFAINALSVKQYRGRHWRRARLRHAATSSQAAQPPFAHPAASGNTGAVRRQTHVSHILNKLHARDRAQLAIIADESGLNTPGRR
jgi:hypothetical protein